MIQLLSRVWAWFVKKHHPDLEEALQGPRMLPVSSTSYRNMLPYHAYDRVTMVIFSYLTVDSKAATRQQSVWILRLRVPHGVCKKRSYRCSKGM